MKKILSLVSLFFAMVWLPPAEAQTILPPVPATGEGCAYNATLPSLTTGSVGWVQCNSNGVLLSVTAPSASPSLGLTSDVAGSAASGVVIKNAPGNLYGAYATCTSACWLMVFNAVAVPSNGATTAGIASGNLQDCVPIPAGGVGSISYSGMPPEIFTVGISAAISSTACGTLTLSTVGFIHGSAQ